MLAPIVLFVYNRPEHTRRTLEALRKNELASASILYVFSDGPKVNVNQEQQKKIDEVRSLIHTISGFKDIFIEEAKENRGLANSVIAGVTKIIEKYGKVIVVEDDIITHPFFLQFMNDCLNIFENRNDIYMIGGFSQNINFPWWYNKEIYLTYRSCSWGWATWQDRWNTADWECKGYQEMQKSKELQKLFARGGDDNFPMLKLQMDGSGKIDSWCIRWDYCMFRHDAFCVIPRKSLVKNCGTDGSGVHCGEIPPNYTAPFPEKKRYYFKLDEKIKFYPAINNRLLKFLRGEPTGYQYFSYYIKKVIHKIEKMVKSIK